MAPSPQPDTYVVKRGDTLYSIALDHGIDWRDLAARNQLTDATRLRVGQTLVMPAPAPAGVSEGPVVVSPVTSSQPIAGRPLGAETQPGAAPPPAALPPPVAGAGGLKTEPKGLRLPYSDENLAALQRGDAARGAMAATPEAPPPAAAPKPEVPPVTKIEPTPAPARAPDARVDGLDWVWPAGGKVTANFNGASLKGIDIAGRVGEPVYASAAGVVQYVGEGIPSMGKLIIIKHNDTYLSAYAHNSEILVKESQKVAKGQQIAKLGSTGAEQPKLHFQIRRQGTPLDPLQFLPTRDN
ncbi:MAG TPA: peptidoglycan DD-metalloendopeptidase family protein [Burkholderiales bacterium]|nr:peptidoglycan DD-metalloendopeptidase family protein [Burkholderiales bacterium]